MKKGFLALFLIITFLIGIFLWANISPIWAQGDASIIWKLNKIMENQQNILSRLNEIKSQLSSMTTKH